MKVINCNDNIAFLKIAFNERYRFIPPCFNLFASLLFARFAFALIRALHNLLIFLSVSYCFTNSIKLVYRLSLPICLFVFVK